LLGVFGVQVGLVLGAAHPEMGSPVSRAAYVEFPLKPWAGLAQASGSSLAGRCSMTTAAPSTALAAIQAAFSCRVRCMPTFVLRLIASRPDFAQTMTDAEREIMSRHAAHWRPYLERGDMVVFGPILTDDDSYGLAVVETDDDQALRDFAAQDPVVTTGTAVFELGRMAAGHVRGR
jgi:uncharacterized protein